MAQALEALPQVFPEEPDDLDHQLDRLVDTGGLSYYEARLRLGVEGGSAAADAVPEAQAPERVILGAPRIRRASVVGLGRAGAYMGPQYGEEAGVGYPGGLAPEHQPRVALSKAQLATNRRGLALARAILATKRSQK
ncbi:MAG TPA: hypothetical protein VFM05_05895 [Candidatus Saccharimonadales bacterium]|nr:hypothetical protein [Candidatus Saccharimonadales bacterium]